MSTILPHAELRPILGPAWDVRPLVQRDRRYLLVPEDWLIHIFVPWWRQRWLPSALPGGWSEGLSDCDDFAIHFASQLILSAQFKRRPDLSAGVAVDRIGVAQQTEQLGIPAGGTHALNIVVTDARRALVVEPQNGQWCPLNEYANEILSCYL